jgi:hypothetical protein
MRKESGDDEMREEYDFTEAEVGRYADRLKEGTNLVVIEPDLTDVFPDSRSVNEALRALADIVRSHRAPSQ